MTTPPPFNGPLPPQPWQADTAAFYRDVARHQDRRRRWVVGEVGIGGIKADAPYRCENGRLVEVDR